MVMMIFVPIESNPLSILIMVRKERFPHKMTKRPVPAQETTVQPTSNKKISFILHILINKNKYYTYIHLHWISIFLDYDQQYE